MGTESRLWIYGANALGHRGQNPGFMRPEVRLQPLDPPGFGHLHEFHGRHLSNGGIDSVRRFVPATAARRIITTARHRLNRDASRSKFDLVAQVPDAYLHSGTQNLTGR